MIQNWVDQGIEDFIFLLHYEAQQIENLLFELKESSSFSNVEFRTVLENKPLGTGGAILNAIDQLKLVESFLVANADTWLSSGVEIISKKSRPTIAAVKTKNTNRYGLLNYEKNKITAFLEKSQSSKAGYVNSGLCLLEPELFREYEAGSEFSLEHHIFPKLVTEGQLNILKLKEEFIDIGIPEDYLKFCKWMEKEKNNEF